MTETAAVREGEEIDENRLRDYLERSFEVSIPQVTVSQFRGGSSNLTYLITCGTDEYVLRRPPFGNTIRSAHDMKREFDVLRKLSNVYLPAPKPLLYCEDVSIIGSEFYLMERRTGFIIRGRAPDILAGSPSMQRAVCRAFIENLAKLHSLHYKDAGVADLGQPAGYPKRQVEGWSGRYFAAKTHEIPELESTISWLNDRIPEESGAALIHNDYKFDNVMLDPDDLTEIAAVLDWEMVTVGDPLMDLGTTLGYWMSPDAGEEMLSMPFNPRVLMENVSRRDLAEMYADASGRDISKIQYYYVFGLFKIAVIAQQIYARYAKGLTDDKRFATFDRFVSKLSSIAGSAISRGKL